MKTILSLIISAALVVSGYSQTRNVLVGTNNTVVQPTNFWSADASNARAGLGLGTAATSPASAFQPSSATLSNLASSNGGSLTNILATNLVGIIPASNIATVNFSNLAGTLSIASGGTSATNAANARQNLGSTTVGDALFIATNAESARTTIGATTVGSSVFTLANPSAITFIRVNSNNTVSALTASDFRTALSLGTAATNPSSAFQPASSLLTNLASGNGGALTNIQASNTVGAIAISNGGSGATTAGGARTNLGLGTTNNAEFNSVSINELRWENGLIFDLETQTFQFPIQFNNSTNTAITRFNFGLGWSALTNSNAATSLLGTGTNGIVVYGNTNQLTFTNMVRFGGGDLRIDSAGGIYWGADLRYEPETQMFYEQINFDSPLTASNTRNNLGLPWIGLTSSNAATFRTALFGSNTNPVLVDTNGSVVSPTNFWQVAPIVTRFVETQPTTNQTTNIVAARNLHIHSLTISVVGVTNTIALPITNSFNGDVALVVHQGPTSSVTAVRTAGAATNIITLNQFEQTVEFIYYDNVWQLNHNQSFIEPIFFSGTNASANAAASRTNLGLGTNDFVIFNGLEAMGVGIEASSILLSGSNAALAFEDESAKAQTRTNFGLGLPALTNTNNANFQAAVFATNTAPTNTANTNGVNFNTAVHWMEVTVQTNGSNVSFRIPLFK